MRIVFKTLRWIIAVPFLIVVFVLSITTIMFFSVSSVIKDPDTIKNVLSSTKAYEKAPDLALSLYFEKLKEDVGKSSRELSMEEILGNRIAEKDLRASLKEIFPPDWLETETEKFLDDVYGYLEGKQDNLSYSLQLDSRMEKAGNVLTIYLKNKLSALPVCPENVPNNFDLFTATCRPANINIAEANKAIAQIGENVKKIKFNKELSLTPEVKNHIRPLQKIFQILPNAVLLLSGLVFLLLSLTVFLIPGNKARWVSVTITSGAVGFVVLFACLVIWGDVLEMVFDAQIKKNMTSDVNLLIPVIRPAVDVLGNLLSLRLALIALIALTLSGLGVVFSVKGEYQAYIKKVFSVVFLLAITLIVFSFSNIKNLGFFY